MNIETTALLFRLPFAEAMNPAFTGAANAAGWAGQIPVTTEPAAGARGVGAREPDATYWYLVGPDGTHPKSAHNGSVLVPPVAQNVAAVAGTEGVN